MMEIMIDKTDSPKQYIDLQIDELGKAIDQVKRELKKLDESIIGDSL